MSVWLFADVAPGPIELGLLGAVGFALCVPAGLVLGSLAYLVLAKRAAKRGDTAERQLPIWQRKLWWRSVKYVAAIVFVGFVLTMTINFYSDRSDSRDRYRDREPPVSASASASAKSARPPLPASASANP